MKNIFSIIILFITISGMVTGKKNIIVLGGDSIENFPVIPSGILEGPERNIYVYDESDAFIKIYSPHGQMIGKIGGKGEGPGQLKRAEGADFGFTPQGKSLWFTEYFMGHKWMSFVDLKGKPGRFIHYKINGFFGIPEAEIYKDGTIFIRVQTPSRSAKKGDIFYTGYRDEIRILRENGSTASVNLARESISTISFIPDGGDIGIPFTPRFLWALTGEGHILFSEGTSTELELYNRNGRELKRIQVPIPRPAPVTDHDLARWKNRIRDHFRNRDRSWYKRFGSVVEKYTHSVHPFKPVIHRMDITPGNHIFLQCLSGNEAEFEYLLTDMAGRLLFRFRSDISRLVLLPSYIVFQNVSDDDEAELSIITRKNSEREDLKNLLKLTRKK